MMLRASISFIVCFLLSWAVVAQPYPSDKGRFFTDVKKGCQPLTVTIDAAFCNGQPCTIDYDEGGGFVGYSNTKTFTEPGVYDMVILFGSTGTDTIRIEVRPNIPPTFELYTCGGNTVVTKITDTNYYDEYVVEYSDGTKDEPVFKGDSKQHTFITPPGPATVSVRGRKRASDFYIDNCTPTVKTIDTSEPIGPAKFDVLEATSASQLRLDLTGSAVTLYKLQIGVNSATTWNNYREVYDLNTLTVDNLQPDNNFYCFRIVTVNPCAANAVVGYSDVICSSDFDAQAQSDANRLNWRTATTGISNYTITKKDPEKSLASLTETPPTLQTMDMDIVCKTEYTYQLLSNYANGSRSISLPKTVTAFSTRQPVAPQNISAVVNGETSVTLSWDQDAAFRPDTYMITKLVNGAAAGTAESKPPTYTDGQYDTSTPTCYTIAYKDLCDNASPASEKACPIQLKGTVDGDNKIILTWSPYLGWAVGVGQYEILKYDIDGNLLNTITSSSTTYTDGVEDFENQMYRYEVRAIPNGGSITPSVSNPVTETKSPNLVYPSAFTPNGDGLNDRFIVFGRYVVDFEMSIFNRWGELMFSTADLTVGWDGTYNGNPMPEGTYVFRAKITDMTGKTYDRSGTVVLLKKR